MTVGFREGILQDGQVIVIRNWNEHFECAQSRKVDGPLQWVAVKTKHDGKGYRRVVGHPNGMAIYGAFHLLVQVGAKCKPRGILRDEDGPLTLEDLTFKTGCPRSIFEEAIQVLSSKGIGWVDVVDDGSSLPLETTQLPPPDRTGPDPTVQNNTTGGGEGGGEISSESRKVLEAILQKVTGAMLSDTRVMLDLSRALADRVPEAFAADPELDVRIVAAAERGIHVGRDKIALFTSIVRARNWVLVRDQLSAARRRIRELREGA